MTRRDSESDEPSSARPRHNRQTGFAMDVALIVRVFPAFLEAACAGDARLLNRVRKLLAAHEKAPGILDGGPEEPAPTVTFVGATTALAVGARCP